MSTIPFLPGPLAFLNPSCSPHLLLSPPLVLCPCSLHSVPTYVSSPLPSSSYSFSPRVYIVLVLSSGCPDLFEVLEIEFRILTGQAAMGTETYLVIEDSPSFNFLLQ
eukprot:763318-Hanusia_phi.AAC.5